MTQKVFITGGAGFIGSRVASALAAKDWSVFVYDSLHPQVHGAEPRPELPAAAHLVRGDVCDRTALFQAIQLCRPDVVLHLAAETGTGQSLDEPSRYCLANVLGTANLIEAMRVVSPSRLVLASSRAIYGEGSYQTAQGVVLTPAARSLAAMKAGRFHPETPDGERLQPAPTAEDAPAQPSSVYASSKLMQEHLVFQTAADAPWSVAVLRLQNVFGPGQSLKNPYTGVLSIFAQALLNGADLEVFEDGAIVRDFVYIDDVLAALVKACDPEAMLPGPVNIGSGVSTSILEAARMLTAALKPHGASPRISGRFRVGDVRHSVADISLARQALGWAPEITFDEGLRNLIEWARREHLSEPLSSFK